MTARPDTLRDVLLMRNFFWLLLLLVGAFVPSSPAQPMPPNIVIILVDDLGYGDVSFNGCPDFATPNIDSIVNNGVRCTNGYVTAPIWLITVRPILTSCNSYW